MAAATDHQVSWLRCDRIAYPDDRLPLWDDQTDGYVDPDTGHPLPTGDQALDELESAKAPAAQDEAVQADGDDTNGNPQQAPRGRVGHEPRAGRCRANRDRDDGENSGGSGHTDEYRTAGPLRVVRFGAQ